jgi:hypothetical protein
VIRPVRRIRSVLVMAGGLSSRAVVRFDASAGGARVALRRAAVLDDDVAGAIEAA